MDESLREMTAYLALMSVKGVGPARLRRLVATLAARGHGIDAATSSAGWAALEESGALPRSARQVGVAEHTDAAQGLLAAGVKLVAAHQLVAEPERWSKLPPFLFVAGADWRVGPRTLAVAGSRHASELALADAASIGRWLARAGARLATGGARGVDTAAHDACLTAGGASASVLAEGVLRGRLASLESTRGSPSRSTIVSEFAPKAGWHRGRAMTRNETVCAMSSALVVVTAGTGGGTHAAGLCALGAGMPVYVLDGGPGGHMSDGCADLLARGARLIERVDRGEPGWDRVLSVDVPSKPPTGQIGLEL